MASIDRLQLAGGVRYRARYRTPDHASRSKTFRRRIDAERFLAHIEHSKHSGAYVEPSAGRVTVREYGEAWRTGKLRQRPASADRLDSALKNWIYPEFGDQALASVHQADVQEWVAHMSASLAPSTVGLNYSFLASLYRHAVQRRAVAFTPCLGVELPEVVKHGLVPLTEPELSALVAAIPDRYAGMLLLAAGSGLREGELWGLTVDRVNFLRRTVTVDRQLVQVKPAAVRGWHEHVDGDLYFGPPKTPASVRTVPVETAIIDRLARHLAAYPPGIKGLIFTSGRGLPIRRSHFNAKPWAAAKRGATWGRDRLVLHDLRHFYASLLIYQGLNVKQVQARMGHRSATETLDTYAAVFDAADDLTRESATGMLTRIVAASDTPLTVPSAASE